jgi:hypothetical protein
MLSVAIRHIFSERISPYLWGILFRSPIMLCHRIPGREFLNSADSRIWKVHRNILRLNYSFAQGDSASNRLFIDIPGLHARMIVDPAGWNIGQAEQVAGRSSGRARTPARSATPPPFPLAGYRFAHHRYASACIPYSRA